MNWRGRGCNSVLAEPVVDFELHCDVTRFVF